MSVSALKKSVRSATALTLLAVLISGCAGSSARNNPEVSRMQSQMQDLRTLLAEHSASLTSLESQYRNSNGRIENIEHRLGINSAAMQYRGPAPDPDQGYIAPSSPPPIYGALGNAHSGNHLSSSAGAGGVVADLSGQNRLPPSYGVNTYDGSGSQAGTPPSTSSFGYDANTSGPPPLVPAAALQEDEVLTDQLPHEVARNFRNALTRLREGAYRDALPFLDQALQLRGMETPNGWGAQVMFWRGVAFDGMGDNSRALGAYHEMTSNYPRHPRTPAALLRQASVFIRLGDVQTAKLTLQKLSAEFPSTPESAAAKERLRKL